MKYAQLQSIALEGIKNEGFTKKSNSINIGDPIRDYALLLLYKKMDISPLILHTDDLHTYSDESVILPINTFICYPYGVPQLPISNKIIPVYLHLAIHDMELFVPEYFQAYQPIGCRDEHTYQILYSKGIQVYLSGCLSLTYPKTAKVPKHGKVFFVDVPNALLEFIPDEIKERAVFLSHQIPIAADTQDELDYKVEAIRAERVKMYEEEASLVVSSKVHCISPCLAIGIPVIWVSNKKEPTIKANGTFLHNLTHLYSVSEYSKINWYPAPVNIEPIKELILRNAECSILDAYEKNRIRTELTDVFCIKSEYTVSYPRKFYLDFFPKKVSLNDHAQFIRGEEEKGGKMFPCINYFLLESIERITGKMLSQMRLVIFGAGNEGKVILYELKHLPRKFLSIVFIDNNEKLYSTTIDNIPVFPVSYLRSIDFSETFILLAGSHHEEMGKQLEEEFNMEEQVHFWKSIRIIASNTEDYAYGPIITPS
jgi:hypothetical protein